MARTYWIFFLLLSLLSVVEISKTYKAPGNCEEAAGTLRVKFGVDIPTLPCDSL